MAQVAATMHKTITREPIQESTRREATDEEIRTRAYEIYLARGGALGFELDDWLQAERELRPRE